MTFRFPTIAPDPDSDLDPTDEAHFEWILEWYLAEDCALRAFDTGDTDSNDPDENGYLTDARWDEEGDFEPFDENDDLVIDDDSDGE